MPAPATELTAARFIGDLHARQSDEELRKIQRYFKSGEGDYGEGDVFMGVRMGEVFELAKRYIDMPPEELEALLESPVHEVRAGACSIMGKSAARKQTSEERRKDLYDLYLRRHDRINNWDLVDLAARDVIGGYLVDRPRDVLRTGALRGPVGAPHRDRRDGGLPSARRGGRDLPHRGDAAA